jgi:hypothetical protein
MKERMEMEAMLDSTVNDHVPTGTPGVLDSPHVSEGPGKIANAPVPSVFVRCYGCCCRRRRCHGSNENLAFSNHSLCEIEKFLSDIFCCLIFHPSLTSIVSYHRETTEEQLIDCVLEGEELIFYTVLRLS